MASEIIEFKMYLRNNGKKSEIRRFSVNRNFLNNFEYLNIKIKKVFPKLKNKSFNLLWNDNEDEVTISSDAELILALACMQENIKKMYIELKHFDQRDLSKLTFASTQPKIIGPSPNNNVRSLDPLCESQKDKKIAPKALPNNSIACNIAERNNSTPAVESSTSCNVNEESLQNDPIESFRLESYQLDNLNDLTEADANSDVVSINRKSSDIETNYEKLTELSKIVNELADITKTLNLQCQNISHHESEQLNACDNFIDHPEIPEDANPLDTNIQVLRELTQIMSQLKNRFSSMNVIWENKNPIYAQSDVCEFLENTEEPSVFINAANVNKNSDVVSDETLLVDLNAHEYDNCSSVKTISESSESMEERWTLLDNDDYQTNSIFRYIGPSEPLDLSNHLSESPAVQIPDTVSTLSADTKHSNLIIEPIDSTSPVEVENRATSVPENSPPNLETRAIFPHIAAALDILGHMGFDVKDDKLLQLTELYDGNVEAVLDTLLFTD